MFLDEEDFFMQENYDLQGLKLVSNGLDWPPFTTLTDCDEDFGNCKAEGLIPDLTQMVARL